MVNSRRRKNSLGYQFSAKKDIVEVTETFSTDN